MLFTGCGNNKSMNSAMVLDKLRSCVAIILKLSTAKTSLSAGPVRCLASCQPKSPRLRPGSSPRFEMTDLLSSAYILASMACPGRCGSWQRVYVGLTACTSST